MAADWIGINSSHLLAGGAGVGFCYENTSGEVAAALAGTNSWWCLNQHTHYVILDLGTTYNVQKIRGRSDGEFPADPVDVNIYVTNDTGSWGVAVATGISTWLDTTSWVEIDTTDKNGRYVIIEIVDTEYEYGRDLSFGNWRNPFSILDVYGEVVGGDLTVTPSALAITLTLETPTLIFPGGSSPSTLAATVTLLAPSVVIGKTVTPSTLEITAGLLVPSVVTGQLVTPSALAITATLVAPSITGDFVMAVDALAITATLLAPTITKNSVTWSTGTLIYKGTSYSITAGVTGDTFIYWDLNDSPTTFKTTNTLTTALGPDKWVMMYNMDGVAYPAYSHKIIHGGIIQADTITTNHLQTSSVTSDKVLTVAASKILIDGAVYLSDWRKTGDVTKIDGGDISASSITLTSSASDFALTSIGGDSDDISEGSSQYFAGESGADVTGSHTAADTALVDGLAASRVSGWAHGSDTTKIDGGTIFTDSIVTGSLAANLITYTELRQVGGSEAVDTGAIRDNATKLYASGSDASETSNNAAYVTVCSANLTSLGGVIEIRFQTTVSDTDLGVTQNIRVWNGSTALWEGEISPANEGFFSATLFDQPGSGSRTYYLQMQSDGAASFTLSGSFVGVTEDKGK